MGPTSPDGEREPGQQPDPELGHSADADGVAGLPPDEQPTIAWTPPEPDPVAPARDPGEPAPFQAAPTATPVPPQTDPTVPSGVDHEPAPPPAQSGWVTPAGSVPPATPLPVVPPPQSGAPLVGWEAPEATIAAPANDGFVVSGVGARLVAYLMDGLLVGLVPAILQVLLLDFDAMMRSVFEASLAGATSYTVPLTPELVLISIIGVAIQFLYFVGFWTSGWRATPGMRGLRMQVVDVDSGGTLSLVAATKRWLAMGYPIALLALIPALQQASGLIVLGISIFLFFTVITDARRQGLHDKWARSLVIRSVTSGSGATVVGCLIVIGIVVAAAIIASVVAFDAILPYLDEYRDLYGAPA